MSFLGHSARTNKRALLASWRRAQVEAEAEERLTGKHVVIKLNYASAAGYLLEQHGGNVRAALAAVPVGFRWWDPVRRYLAALRGQEAAA